MGRALRGRTGRPSLVGRVGGRQTTGHLVRRLRTECLDDDERRDEDEERDDPDDDLEHEVRGQDGRSLSTGRSSCCVNVSACLGFDGRSTN